MHCEKQCSFPGHPTTGHVQLVTNWGWSKDIHQGFQLQYHGAFRKSSNSLLIYQVPPLCGAVSPARALQLFSKSPGALLCVFRKCTFLLICCPACPLKINSMKCVHRARILHQLNADVNTQKTPQLTNTSQGVWQSSGSWWVSPYSSGVWDRLVLIVLLSISSVSESLGVQ